MPSGFKDYCIVEYVGGMAEQMNSMLKTLIIITLIYYLLKGLIYFAMWQMTYKVQERALEEKRKREEKRLAKREKVDDRDLPIE
jgi:uncharacterized membrane protein YciS (DUF1049 family)